MYYKIQAITFILYRTLLMSLKRMTQFVYDSVSALILTLDCTLYKLYALQAFSIHVDAFVKYIAICC